MNKKVSAFIAIALAAGTMVGCSSKSSSSASGEEGKVINVYSWNDEFRQRVEAVYPEVKETSKDGSVTKLKDGSEIHWIINPNQDGVYQQKLDEALEKQDSASADDKVDIFLSETDYVSKYTSKEANVAMPLKDLGINPMLTVYRELQAGRDVRAYLSIAVILQKQSLVQMIQRQLVKKLKTGTQ